MITVYPAPSTSVTVTSTISQSTPTLVQTDSQLYDDDGIPYVNPNVPGADIATGDKQSQQLAALQQIAAGVPVSQLGAWIVAVGSQPASVLAPMPRRKLPTASAGSRPDGSDAAGTQVISASIVQLGQPLQESPDVLREDINLQLQ